LSEGPMNDIEPPPLSSLEPQETSRRPQGPDIIGGHEPADIDYAITPISAEETRLRHSGWAENRGKVYRSLVRTCQSRNRLDSFCNCGGGCVVQRHETSGRHRLVGNYCHDRLCLPCGNARARRLAASLRKRMAGKVTRLTTLTLRHSQTPLKDQLDRLIDCFRKLRKAKATREAYRGGVAFIEIKWVNRSRTWHPHLHVITEGAYVPQKALATAWHAITGDSFIVHITRISESDRMVAYVTKYASKPMDSTVFADDDALDELLLSVKGRRLNQTFGTWKKLLDEDPTEDGAGWVTIGTLAGLQADAEGGDVVAAALLAQLTAPSKARATRPEHSE